MGEPVAEKSAVAEEPAAAHESAVAEKPTAAERSADAAEPIVEEPEVSGSEGVEEPVAEKAKAGEASTDEPEIVEKSVVDEPTVAETAAETEAATAAETRTSDEPESSSVPETSAEEPAADPEGEAQPAPEAEAEAEAKPTPEAEEKPTADPEPSATPEPAAADGAQPPQGPPAADDESRTGGAGGHDTAEGEAEAEAAPKPPITPKPALTLTQLKTRAPGLATAYRTAATTLKTHNLTGTRAKVYLVLDRSASMRPYYKDGSAQALAEQTLALAAHLDPEATVPVVFFSTELDGTGEITLTDHENKIDDLHASLGRMGRTSYHAAVEAVLARHDKETPGTPALVVFQTDGAPDAKTPATQSLTDAAKTHPTVFFSFVAFGDPENKAFDYLRKLKTPNTSHFLAGETPRELTDKQLYDGVLANWRP
ncbi:VWA domain-containing protein [Streptomyces olindensis]|uniref:VWA domain-containing protein n=1 Tax=Streptomyces olindensis TaxID=358823 RepID=UPI003646D209